MQMNKDVNEGTVDTVTSNTRRIQMLLLQYSSRSFQGMEILWASQMWMKDFRTAFPWDLSKSVTRRILKRYVST